jgi:hypothetical protein
VNAVVVEEEEDDNDDGDVEPFFDETLCSVFRRTLKRGGREARGDLRGPDVCCPRVAPAEVVDVSVAV